MDALKSARLFIEKEEKGNIIPELFNFFGVDCLTRRDIDFERLDSLITEFTAGGEENAELLAEIIELLQNADRETKRRENELKIKIEDFISEHYREDVSIEQIAHQLNLSYYYMCHFFKAHTGMSLSEFRNRKRIEAAIKRLCGGNAKIADIATECGFNSVSYFTEAFTRLTGKAPTAFKAENQMKIYDFHSLSDILLGTKLRSYRFLSDKITEIDNTAVQCYTVFEPDEKFKFLHEAAVIAFKDVLYAAWYNNYETELHGYTPIRFSRSFDGGKSWTEPKTVADDQSGKYIYCPPVFGICEQRLYMLANTMVGADLIHSFDIYCFNGQSEEFELISSEPLPFKLNTNVVTLPNGKLLLPGRTGRLDGFPNTPAVLISDSGKIASQWRLVKIAENGDLPDSDKLVHPEISVILSADTLYMFCRNDNRFVPLVYISNDYGESWESLATHDIPYISSKIYTGTLSDGRHFLIANEYINVYDRTLMVAYFTENGNMKFTKRLVLADYSTPQPDGALACHYPAACEYNGCLYIIASKDCANKGRGAVIFVINISDI